LTAAIFLTLTAYVRWSGKNFSYLGGFLMVATVGLFLAGLLFLFFPSANASYFMAWIGALVFSGWILYDTSAVTRQYYQSGNVVGAILALYLDILNLFLMLLRILSGNRSRD
jgi:FtsH-binding integral membrane protein